MQLVLDLLDTACSLPCRLTLQQYPVSPSCTLHPVLSFDQLVLLCVGFVRVFLLSMVWNTHPFSEECRLCQAGQKGTLTLMVVWRVVQQLWIRAAAADHWAKPYHWLSWQHTVILQILLCIDSCLTKINTQQGKVSEFLLLQYLNYCGYFFIFLFFTTIV